MTISGVHKRHLAMNTEQSAPNWTTNVWNMQGLRSAIWADGGANGFSKFDRWALSSAGRGRGRGGTGHRASHPRRWGRPPPPIAVTAPELIARWNTCCFVNYHRESKYCVPACILNLNRCNADMKAVVDVREPPANTTTIYLVNCRGTFNHHGCRKLRRFLLVI